MSQDLISKNQVVSPLTPTRCASGSRMEVADFVSVPENIAASSVGAPMGPSPAPIVPVRPMHLRIDYWQRMLFEVYDAPHAHKVLTMLADGVRVGRPRAAQAIVSPNWPSALEHGAKVADIIAMDLSLGRLHGPFSSPPYQAYIVSP